MKKNLKIKIILINYKSKLYIKITTNNYYIFLNISLQLSNITTMTNT